MQQLIDFSAALDDRSKVVVDFWANNPGSVTPPGQWTQFAETVSAQDAKGLNRDVKLFFAIGQAALAASIVAWDAKRAYDTVRPITAIRYYFQGQMIRSWGGPGQGAVWLRGEDWKSAAMRWTDLRFTFPALAVPFDPTVPAAPGDAGLDLPGCGGRQRRPVTPAGQHPLRAGRQARPPGRPAGGGCGAEPLPGSVQRRRRLQLSARAAALAPPGVAPANCGGLSFQADAARPRPRRNTSSSTPAAASRQIASATIDTTREPPAGAAAGGTPSSSNWP